MSTHTGMRLLPLALMLTLAACAADEEGTASAADTTGAARELAGPAGEGGTSSVLGAADVSALGERVVTQSAGIREGEKVLITGSARDLPLLEELAVQARRVGAHPMVTVTSEQLEHRLVKDVPERYDTQRPELALAIIPLFDVVLSVDYGETPGLFADIAPERMARLAQTQAPVQQAMLRRGVRAVNLGNGMYPTPAIAERLGVDEATLRPMFTTAIAVDPATIQARGDSLKVLLSGPGELHITHPNGTDLRLRIEGRPVQVSDGAISPEDVAAGPAGRTVWLPAGEVYVTPVAGTANGRVAAERIRYEGQWVEGLNLDVRQGRVVSLTARSGGERLQAAYAAAGAGKDLLGVIDFGINPAVNLPASSAGIWVADGFVSVVVGSNTWAGGDNQVPFEQVVHLGGATVKLGDRTIVDAGRLTLQ